MILDLIQGGISWREIFYPLKELKKTRYKSGRLSPLSQRYNPSEFVKLFFFEK
jgi:hypothetical protein